MDLGRVTRLGTYLPDKPREIYVDLQRTRYLVLDGDRSLPGVPHWLTRPHLTHPFFSSTQKLAPVVKKI